PFLIAQAGGASGGKLSLADPGLGELAELDALFTLGSSRFMKPCSSIDQFRSILSGFKALSVMQLMFHGGEGQILIGGEVFDLLQLTQILKGAKLPAVDTIRFVNCEVMSKVVHVPAFGRLFRAKQVIGFNLFRLLQR